LNSKKCFYIKKDYLKSFLEYAIKTGYYDEKEARERLGDDVYDELEIDLRTILESTHQLEFTSKHNLIPPSRKS